MSHYYLAAPAQLEAALAEYCVVCAVPEAKVEPFKRAVREFLDSPVAVKHRIRIDSPDPVLPKAMVSP